jgi:segregation and condensation protein B
MEKKHLGALLFVSKEPLTLDELANLLEVESTEVLKWVDEFQEQLQGTGISIRLVAGKYEMVSADECFEIVEKVVPKEYEKLSRSANETVTIIAYNQPIKRSMIGKIRGKQNPDYGITPLIEMGLIEDTPEGYITTKEFLRYFGINSLKDLPRITLDDVKPLIGSSDMEESDSDEKDMEEDNIEEKVEQE